MKTIDSTSKYNGIARTESRVEEYTLYEDFLLLARQAEEAAKAAYAYTRATAEANAQVKSTAERDLIQNYVLIVNKLAQIDAYKNDKNKEDVNID